MKRIKATFLKDVQQLKLNFSQHRFVYLFVFFSFLIIVGLFVQVSNKIKNVSNATRRTYNFLSRFHPDLSKAPPLNQSTRQHLFCHKLKHLPMGDEIGLIKDVKTISLSGVNAPYNAAIEEGENGEYLLFFRFDLQGDMRIHSKFMPFRSYIACAKLDRKFNQIQQPILINTRSDFSEDPRVVKVKDKLYLSYNDLEMDNPFYSRTMRVACLDKKDLSVEYSLNLDLNLQPIEKNWVPFVIEEKDQEPRILFSYGLNPHKVFKLDDLRQNHLSSFVFPNKVSLQRLPWNSKWGNLRGGTPAKIVDGEYLAFFHSSFQDEKIRVIYYVMGAYTFEASPPFRITKMSKFPITFKNMYNTPHTNTGNQSKMVIFPAGFIVEKTADGELIHLSCGENDSGIKIITFDKEVLFKSLEPVAGYTSQEITWQELD